MLAGSMSRARVAPRGPFLLSGSLAFWMWLAINPSAGQVALPAPLPRNNFGSVGLIEMPSARFAQDGELSVGASFFKNTQHYNLGFEIFPWLEGSFHYSGLQHFDPAYPVYYDRSFALKARLWDEAEFWPAFAIGANDVVGTGAYSGEYLVMSKQFGSIDATLGVGWGRLGSSALVRNPIIGIAHSFENRTLFPNIVPGATAFNTLFHGPNVGIFGGLVYKTPLDGLSLIAEYSSDTYQLESSRNTFTPRSQFNFGASYQLSDHVIVGANWLYGRAIGGNFTFQLDPVKPQFPQKIDPPPSQEVIRTSEQQQKGIAALLQQNVGAPKLVIARTDGNSLLVDTLWSQADVNDVSLRGQTLVISSRSAPSDTKCHKFALLASSDNSISALNITGAGREIRCNVRRTVRQGPVIFASNHIVERRALTEPLTIDATAIELDPNTARLAIIADAIKQSIHIDTVTFKSGRAVVYYSNFHYEKEIDAIERLVRILMADAPSEIEEFRLISVMGGIAQREFDVLRSPVERNFVQEGELNLFAGALTQKPAPIRNPILADAQSKVYPGFDWGLFPQFRQQLFDPNNPFGVQFLAALSASLNLFPGLSLNAQGEADIYDNFTTNRSSDSQLPHVRTDFARYFTEGKNGIGQLQAEYRFRPSPNVSGLIQAGILESMFDGVGGEVLWRPEGARWGIGVDAYQVWQRDFNRLLGLQSYKTFTGHISLYYQAPFYNLNFALRAGQYLAGDRGATLEITRRFATGIEIGAFFTKTNVSAAQFGEGSFDKGIIIRIPLGWVAPLESQSQIAIDLRPLQRDGGQRLLGDAILWEQSRRTSEGEILTSLGQ